MAHGVAGLQGDQRLVEFAGVPEASGLPAFSGFPWLLQLSGLQDLTPGLSELPWLPGLQGSLSS